MDLLLSCLLLVFFVVVVDYTADHTEADIDAVLSVLSRFK